MSCLSENPFDFEGFSQSWRKHLAEQSGVRRFFSSGLLSHRVAYLKGLVGINELRFDGWRIGWYQDFTEERLDAFREMHRKTRWDCMRMIWSEDRVGYQQFSALEALGYKPIHAEVPPHYVVDLHQGWNHYFASLSRNVRSSVRRTERAAAELNPQLVPFEGEHAVERFFEQLFEHHIRYWKMRTGRSYFEDPAERSFTMDWAKALHAENRLALDTLQLDGQTANLGMGIRDGNRLLGFFGVNTGIFMDHTPGILALHARIRQAAETGITQMDLGFGSHFYKTRAATRRVPRRELLLANPRSLLGNVYVRYLQRRLAGFTIWEKNRHQASSLTEDF